MKLNKGLSALAMTSALLAATPFVAFAATKINSVNVKFTINGYNDNGMPEIEASTNSNNYSVGPIELVDSSNGDSATDYSTAKYSIDLSANDDYVFYISKSSQVKLNGGGATYVSSSRQDSGATLHVVLKFDKLNEYCGDTSYVSWDGNGKLSWQAAQNAKQYKVTVYSGDRVVGSAYTGGTTYDCKPFMLTPGDYYARITPETASQKGNTVKTDAFTISASQASTNNTIYALQKETVTTGEGSGPSSVSEKVLNSGWKQSDNRWWYQNASGDYIQCNWLQDKNAWYFFDSYGYMVTNAAITWDGSDYYFGEDGKMVVSSTIPDGRKAGSDGALSYTAKN